jgi:hypothetical protein
LLHGLFAEIVEMVESGLVSALEALDDHHADGPDVALG